MMSIGVLVTNYNSWSLALECIGQHRKLHGDELARVVLLDDGSMSPPPESLPQGFDLVRNESNLGFAASLNRGVREVATDLVVIFDADAFALTPYVQAVRSTFTKNPELGLLGFATVNSQGQPTASTLPEPTVTSLLLGQRLHDQCSRWFGVTPGTMCITTAAMAVRRRAFDEVGGFDEKLSWLDVDTDFSMTINRSAWKLQIERALVARHDTGGTPMSTAERVRRFYASRWYLLRKHRLLAHVHLAKTFILLRISLELLVLKIAGKLLYRNNVARRRDKLAGRWQVLCDCWNHYA